LRFVSGAILMAFVVTHLLNHALLLVSLGAAENARAVFLLIWRNPAGSILLYGAVAVHAALALLALYRRRTLVMPLGEAGQILLGLAIPVLLAEHVVGTRVFHALTGVEDTYAYVLEALWSTTFLTARQSVALVVVWLHGCLGLYFWMRFRAWYPRVAPWLLIVVVLVPVLALLGFFGAARELAAEAAPSGTLGIDPAILAEGMRRKGQILVLIYASFVSVLALVLGLRILRIWGERRNLVEIRYSDGQVVRVAKGHTVLEASRIGGIPHYAVCGGRGRCSTCRVRVSEGHEQLPPPNTMERATLARIGAEPDVRLACQLRPATNVSVTPLLNPERGRTVPSVGLVATPGREKEIAILFCDLRNFTELTDHRLPFDVVFLLNRYFSVVGKAVEQAGGRVDKFIGDGAMALFGAQTTKNEACRQALSAAASIIEGIALLNEELAEEIGAPLQIAIGIHVGPAIIGLMGYRDAMGVTAVGDTVNIASRLELAAKDMDVAIVISETAAQLSGVDLTGFDACQIDIRGRAHPLQVRAIPHGASIAAPSGQGAAAE
jgi:adenylate cyclase